MQLSLDIHGELIVDNFAGGGGASTGIELALGRRVDIAINHDPEAVAMHSANHPETRHYCESVWDVNPREITQGRPVGLVWLSPDCKHFSKAKGGKPVEKKIRGLAWVALRWAATVQPRVIMLENVEEFTTWGPLIETADGQMRPCPKRKGREFNAFRNALRRQGYQVEHRELRACDYGTPTIRKRLFLIARRDGAPIVWPAPTHGDPKSDAVKHKRLKPWRTAAECIDWSIPCPSIFERTRPLADATLRRIAKGIMRYVVNAAEPFIVPQRSRHENESHHPGTGKKESGKETLRGLGAIHLGQDGTSGKAREAGTEEGSRTGRPKPDLIAAFLAKHYTGVVGAELKYPAPTVTSVDHNSLVAAHLVHMGHGEQSASGAKRWSHGVRDITDPINTVTATGAVAGIVTSNLIKLRGDNVGHPTDEPLHTVSAGGTHFAEARAFLIKYYGADQDPRMEEPLHTITTKDRFGLVTVAGEDYAIIDIGLRMLAPKELYRAQGFPAGYIIEWGVDATGARFPLTKTAQTRMCGNSVCPPLAAALVRANVPELAARRIAA